MRYVTPCFSASLTLLLVTLVGCASKSHNKELAYGHFKIGVSMLSQNNRERALEQLLKASELDPENVLILNHLGLAYYFLGEYEKAIISLNKALRIKPDYTEAQNNLGRTYIEIKDFQKARSYLSKASQDLTYASKDKVWLNLGLSYFYENKFAKSQNYFIKSVSFNRDNCLAYNYYGRSLLETKDFDKASTTLDQAIYHCRKKGLDEPHYYGAIALHKLGYKAKALARLQEAKKLFPEGSNKEKIVEMINLLRVTE